MSETSAFQITSTNTAILDIIEFDLVEVTGFTLTAIRDSAQILAAKLTIGLIVVANQVFIGIQLTVDSPRYSDQTLTKLSDLFSIPPPIVGGDTVLIDSHKVVR